MSLTTRIPEQRCRRCRFKITATTFVQGDAVPTEGCVSICVACGLVQLFNADLTLRDPTPDEKAKLDRSQIVTTAQIARAYAIEPTKLKGKPK